MTQIDNNNKKRPLITPLVNIDVVVEQTKNKTELDPSVEVINSNSARIVKKQNVTEIGGRGGLDPTRFGDWEKNGRCIDF